MQDLKFELSVVFTKTGLTPLSDNNTIKQEYLRIFHKELTEENLCEMLGIIIEDQYKWGEVIEIPEDFELKKHDI